MSRRNSHGGTRPGAGRPNTPKGTMKGSFKRKNKGFRDRKKYATPERLAQMKDAEKNRQIKKHAKLNNLNGIQNKNTAKDHQSMSISSDSVHSLPSLSDSVLAISSSICCTSFNNI